MTTQPGQLKTIVCASKRIRELRNAALNIMENIKETNGKFGALAMELEANNLEVDRLAGESQLSYLERTALHLANVEADVAKAELLSATRTDIAGLTKPHEPASVHVLPVNRQSTRLGRAFQKLANTLG